MAQANKAKTAIAAATKAATPEDAIAKVIASMSAEQLTALLAAKGVALPKAPKETKPEIDAQSFKGKVCKVVGGRKMVGETIKVYHVTKGSERRKPLAIAEGAEVIVKGVTPVFINPAHLEIVGDMSPADIKRLDDFQKEQSEETLYVAATAKISTEKSILLSHPRWVKDVYFSVNGMISLTGFDTADGTKIFEVAAWQVRKQCGSAAYDELVAQQPALTAIVEAKA